MGLIFFEILVLVIVVSLGKRNRFVNLIGLWGLSV